MQPTGWDEMLKMLVRANPQDFVSLLAQDAHYMHDITQELIVRMVKADFLCKALRNGEEVIIHIEFQRNQHPKMDRRMWEYNCVTAYLTCLPVCSFVIYLCEEENIVEPPYRMVLSDGKIVHVFYYENIFLWEVPPEVLKQKGLEGLLPLLPLTKGADKARDVIIDDMITGLQAAGKEDILALGYAIAGRVYQTKKDELWLKRRFEMFGNFLEDSWSYREMMQKGLQKGLDQGLKALRHVLINMVKVRFPELTPLAQQQAERISEPEQLSMMIDKLLVAQTPEKGRQVLMDIEPPPQAES